MKKCPICGKEYTEGSTCASCGIVLIDLESSQAVNVVQEQKEQRERQKQDLREKREQEKQQKLEQRQAQASGADRTPVQTGLNPKLLILIIVVIAVVIICILVVVKTKNKNRSSQITQDYTTQTEMADDTYTYTEEETDTYAEDAETDEIVLNEKDFADTEWQTYETELFAFSLPAYWNNLCNIINEDNVITFYQARSQAAGYDGTLFSVMRIPLSNLSECGNCTLLNNDELYAYIIQYPDDVTCDNSDEYTVLEYERLLEDVSVIRNSFEVSESESDYIISDSDSRYLTKQELMNYTAEELKYARNEIYARHGRLFQDETIQAYFDSKDWYNGTIEPDDFTQSMLNEYELANATLILDFEKEMGYVN